MDGAAKSAKAKAQAMDFERHSGVLGGACDRANRHLLYRHAVCRSVLHRRIIQMSRELATIDQRHSASRDPAAYAPRSKLGAVRERSKRTGPLPPLPNLLEMEDRVKALAWQGTILSLLVIVCLLFVMAASLGEMTGWW
jgi:hypothetical protein